MSEGAGNLSRSFVYLLAASIVAGYTLQANWAIDHHFDYFSARVFATALVLFVFLKGIQAACHRVLPAVNERFNDQYGEVVLLLSVVPAALVVENIFLRTVGILVWLAIVLLHASSALHVRWARLLVDWIRSRATRLFILATRAPVSYQVRDDVEESVLQIVVSKREDTKPSAAEIKRRVALLYQELPDDGEFEEIRVNIDGVDRVDEVLPLLLEPLPHYAALRNINKIVVVGDESRVKEASNIVPKDRFEFRATGT